MSKECELALEDKDGSKFCPHGYQTRKQCPGGVELKCIISKALEDDSRMRNLKPVIEISISPSIRI